MPIPLLLAVALAAASLARFATAAPLTLDQALELAVQHSEATHSAQAGAASATEAARVAGQWMDPTLRAGVENLPVTGADRLSTTRDSMTMKRIGIAQEWLSAEKRGARQAAAEAIVGRESVQVQIAAADTRLQAALAYGDAYYANQTVALTTLMEHHADDALAAARARLPTAAGSSPDVLALVGERGLAEDESAESRQLQAAASVALARWLGAPADDLQQPAAASPLPEPAYVAAHPAVLALRSAIEVARREATVAASNRQPNWTWEVSYGQRSGYSDMVSVGVSIPLAVSPAQRQDRETASKLALVDRAEASLAEAVRAATAEYRALLGDAVRLADRIERYRGAVLVSAQQRMAAATASYGSNQAPLVVVFEARRAELEAQRKLLTLQRDLARAQARLAYTPLAPGAQP